MLAYVDQTYTAAEPAAAAAAQDMDLVVVKQADAKRGLRAAAQTLDCGARLRLSRPLSSVGA